MKKLLVLGFALALACAAYATYPTLTGPTGLILVPSAAVAPAGQFQVSLDWWNMFGEDAIAPVRVLYGINDQFEVGAMYMTAEGSDSNIWGINAKYVLPFTAGDAAWAVGASFMDGDNSDSAFGASLSATKAFNENLKGTAALQWSEEPILFGDEFSLAFGAEATVADGLTLVGEYVNFLPGAELNMAARYAFTPALTGEVGFVFDTQAPFIGASYAFGAAE